MCLLPLGLIAAEPDGCKIGVAAHLCQVAVDTLGRGVVSFGSDLEEGGGGRTLAVALPCTCPFRLTQQKVPGYLRTCAVIRCRITHANSEGPRLLQGSALAGAGLEA